MCIVTSEELEEPKATVTEDWRKEKKLLDQSPVVYRHGLVKSYTLPYTVTRGHSCELWKDNVRIKICTYTLYLGSMSGTSRFITTGFDRHPGLIFNMIAFGKLFHET